jgi:anti-sigma regulatory factor (Ser/Thr protein kinase)
MDTPADSAGNSRARVLGSLTIPGRPEQVGLARAFVARTLDTNQVGADADTATLLTSEIVTNAIQHTKSGVDGGTVTIVVIGISRGVLVEIIDDGSAGTPVVKGDLYAAEGHGLFLVQHLASQWGYLRDPAGTTVWFHLPATYDPRQTEGQPGPSGGRSDTSCGRPGLTDSTSRPSRSPYARWWPPAAPALCVDEERMVARYTVIRTSPRAPGLPGSARRPSGPSRTGTARWASLGPRPDERQS